MTPPCPRCGAPLHGSVCAACGARFDQAAPAHYPPPPQQYPYYPPPQPPYARAVSRPSAMGGGVMTIVIFSLYLLFALLGILGSTNSPPGEDKDNAVIGGAVMLVISAVGLAMGVYMVKGRWWGGLVAGVIHAIIGLFLVLALIGVIVAEDRIGGGDRDAFGAIITVLVVMNAVTWTAMVLSFIGMARLKDRGAHVHPAIAAQHF